MVHSPLQRAIVTRSIRSQLPRPTRCFASVPTAQNTAATAPGQRTCYVSTATCPFTNLAIEEHLFRDTHPPSSHALFLYRNSDSIVIGRNQNPWTECNVRGMLRPPSAAQVQFVRRQSGGGAVLHDLGNANYSLITPRDQFERSAGTSLLVRTLRNHFGASTAHVTSRNDVAVGGEDGGEDELKVSGSAYKMTSRRAYHHGTLLLASDIQRLAPLLRTPYSMAESGWVSKGVASVPSPVTTLLHHLHADTIHSSATPEVQESMWWVFVHAIASEYLAAPSPTLTFIHSEEAEANPKIVEYRRALQDWDWAWGQTPEFRHNYTMAGGNTMQICVKSGIIVDVVPTTTTTTSLKGRRYNEWVLETA